MSKAVESPLTPCSSRYLKRRLVSSGDPNPANWRIVQSRPRYMVGWVPRVKGKRPGSPTSRRSSAPVRLAASSTSGMGMPESVARRALRRGTFPRAWASSSAVHCSRSDSTFASSSRDQGIDLHYPGPVESERPPRGEAAFQEW